MTTPLETLRAALRAYDLSGPLTKERNQATHDVINAARTLALSGTPETPTRCNKVERLAMQYATGCPMPVPQQDLTEAEAAKLVADYRAAYPATVFVGMDFAAIESRTASMLAPGYCGDPYAHDCGRVDCPTSDSYRSPKP
jgi:hypothetical protein